jgi:glyoxylase-like metal-dependent hydrolase (beta-lactamase superfamily II)
MKKITSNVYIEDSYPGVIVGAILTDAGMVLIDAPLRPDDGREWLAEVRNKQDGGERTLVYLDSHPDRTLGGRALESTIIAHEAVGKVFEDRPSIFKAQVPESGTEWETCTGLSGIRWAPPHLAFNLQMHLHSGETEIIFEHHPGPEDGAAWVLLPEAGVLFVGDLVTIKQPPFLSMADLTAWDQSLELLTSQPYQGYTIIGSREGKIKERAIKDMRKFIGNVHKQMERLARRKSAVENVEKHVDKLLGSFDFTTRYRNQYYQRMLYGLQHLYSQKYLKVK